MRKKTLVTRESVVIPVAKTVHEERGSLAVVILVAFAVVDGVLLRSSRCNLRMTATLWATVVWQI